jgi:hypothetical protein
MRLIGPCSHGFALRTARRAAVRSVLRLHEQPGGVTVDLLRALMLATAPLAGGTRWQLRGGGPRAAVAARSWQCLTAQWGSGEPVSARAWIEGIRLGRIVSFAEIAKRESQGERYIRLLAPLAYDPSRRVRRACCRRCSDAFIHLFGSEEAKKSSDPRCSKDGCLKPSGGPHVRRAMRFQRGLIVVSREAMLKIKLPLNTKTI